MKNNLNNNVIVLKVRLNNYLFIILNSNNKTIIYYDTFPFFCSDLNNVSRSNKYFNLKKTVFIHLDRCCVDIVHIISKIND